MKRKGSSAKEARLDTPSAHAAALWAGLTLLLLLVLSLLVVRQRQTHKVTFGDEGVPALAQAIRAFGNAAEYGPAGVLGLTVLAMVNGNGTVIMIHTCGAILFLGRLSHAIGLSISGGPSILRSAGMVLTWVAYIIMAVALLISAAA